MTASVEVIERNAAIKARLSQVTDLIEELCNLSTAQSQDPTLEENRQRNQTHRAVVEEVWKLLYTIRGPVDSIFSHFENVRLQGFYCNFDQLYLIYRYRQPTQVRFEP